MKSRIILTFLLMFWPLPALADQQTELAEEFMELTHVNKMMAQIEDQVVQMQAQILAQMQIPEGKEEEAATFQKEVQAKVQEIMDFEKMRGEYLELFTSVYSEQELREMVQFFKSPTGQNMLEKQSMVIQQALEISQNRVGMLIPELQRMTEEFEQSLAPAEK
jgi:uncharacterized protein